MKIICLEEKVGAWQRYYFRVRDDVSWMDLVAGLAEAMCPDNEPYGTVYYTSTRSRVADAAHACGFELVEMETVSLETEMSSAPKPPSCGGHYVSFDSKASLQRLVEYLGVAS